MSKFTNRYRCAFLQAVFCSVIGIFLSATVSAEEFEVNFRNSVSAFLDSLDEGQVKLATLPLKDKKNRWQMQYTGGKRPGIEISKLNVKQRAAMKKALRMVVSEEGWELATAVAKLDGKEGLDKYWITCFGDPRKGEAFAFRIAEHHLTLVHLELEKGETKEFGPILLGSNPPKVWHEDEDALIAAWKKINHGKLLVKNKSGIASKPMAKGVGVPFSSLNTEGQNAIKSAWKKRLRIFTPPIQKRINALHTTRGGWEKSRVAYYNEVPEKRCADGGRWDFKCSLPGMVWDYEASRAHIHMSLWVKKN